MERCNINGVCTFLGDRDTELAVVLVHGHICNEVGEQIQDLIGKYSYVECYQDGGYLLTIATSTDDPLDIQDANRIISSIYDEVIPNMLYDNQGRPIVVSIQEEPIKLGIDNWDIDTYFIGGIHGYKEDGTSKYQE